MIVDEICAAYPACWGVVLCFERQDKGGWQDARDKGISSKQFQEETRRRYIKMQSGSECYEEGLAQIDSQDFLRYIAAKLGAF